MATIADRRTEQQKQTHTILAIADSRLCGSIPQSATI